MRLAVGLLLGGCALAGAARAYEPTALPGTATALFETTSPAASVVLPLGRYMDGSLPQIEVEGQLRRRSWEIGSSGMTTLQILRPLRRELDAQEYEIILDCAAAACGGYDFRYEIPVLPAPEMYVDLFDFRVLTAKREAGGTTEYVYILVSRGRARGFVQVYDVVEADPGQPAQTKAIGEPPVAQTAPGPSTVAAAGLIDRLRRTGHVVLSDLEFASGADELTDRESQSLATLAEFLKGNPARIIALVGHTDAVGSLDANIALSRRRAASVRATLLNRYGVSGQQVTAHGTGYLAPLSSNLTPDGREMNRRVEAILLAAE